MSLSPIFHLTTKTAPISERLCYLWKNTSLANVKNLVNLRVYTREIWVLLSTEYLYLLWHYVVWSVVLSNVRLCGIIIRSTSMLIYISPRNYVNVNNSTFIRICVSYNFLERNKRLNFWCTKQTSRNTLVHLLQASLNCFVATAVVISTHINHKCNKERCSNTHV